MDYETAETARPDLLALIQDHSVLRGAESGPARESLLRELERHLEPDEVLLAYADRSLRPPEALPLDCLLATERQLMRLVMMPPIATGVYHFHRLHVPLRFLYQLGLEIFLSQDETFWRWKLIPAVPTVHVRLPPALRISGEEEWWSWDPPPLQERSDRIQQLLRRALMWRRAYEHYRRNGSSPTPGRMRRLRTRA
ncbi:MAG: hypothetical protein Kow00129_11280 [Thermoleophilia bacterium]